jgi:hypothetical protein
MTKKRLLFYNDARHYYMYCYEPPIRLVDAWAPVDEIAGTRVDTFVYGFGAGPTMFHDTKVGEIWGSHLKRLPGLHAWRAYENVKSLIDRGLDPLNVLIERAHDKGLHFYASLRQSHGIDPKDADNEFNWQFRIDHPEWCLKGEGKYNFNFVHPEVRAERFVIIEETVNRYDVDGFEVDWLLSPHFFEKDEIEQNTPILTEYMRQIRQAVAKAAQERGRPIALGARVLPTAAGNLSVGLDVPTWMKEGLLDFVVPNYYVDQQMDANFPFEWLVDLARAGGCQVYPAIQANVISVGGHEATAAHYYAGAASYYDRGADGLYFPWFQWPVGPQGRQLLSELDDPDLLKEKPKHYVLRRHDEEAASRGYIAQLPVTLTPGTDAPGQAVHVYVADDSENGDATLRVRLSDSTTHDSITVSLNGEALPEDASSRTSHGYTYTWLEYPLARGALRRGVNEVAVALHARPPNLASALVLDSVEVVVAYSNPQLAEKVSIP